MRYVAAYMLAALAGNESVTVANLETILSSVGVEMDKTAAEKVVAELKGKSLSDLVEAGTKKLASVPAGGAAPAAASASAAAPAAAAAAAAAPAKKKEKTPEPSEDEDMGFGLFD